MNLGQELGILQLRIADLEEGGAVAAGDSPMVVRLQALLAQARKAEADALVLVTQEREAREKAEAALKAAQAADVPLVASLKSTVRALEATIRGKDMQISEAARKLDAAEQRAREATKAEALPGPCPVCAKVRAAMGGAPVSPPQQAVTPRDDASAVRLVRDALFVAAQPLGLAELVDITHRRRDAVASALTRMHGRGEIRRFGDSGQGAGITGTGYRYWLAVRPLPQGQEPQP